MRAGPAALAALVAAAGCRGPETAGNVLIVVLDDLGQDKVSSYGVHPDAPETPEIDELAARGMRFTQAWAYPTCSPTRAALLTGQHARRHGIGHRIAPNVDDWELQVGVPTLPGVLGERAPERWDTSFLGKWHLSAGTHGQSPRRHPALHGFAWHEGQLGNLYAALTDDVPFEERGYYAWEEIRNGDVAWKRTYATTEVVDDALERARRMREPWLMWVALPSVHTPLDPPPPHLHGGLAPVGDVERVDAMVRAMDREVGRLLRGLGPVADRTTVILLGDNGTAAHGIAPPLDPARGKGSVYEGGVRVPLIVAGPPVDAPGTVSDALVHVVDVLPTVAELAGADVYGLALDGESWLPVLSDPEAEVHETLFTETFTPLGPGPVTGAMSAIRDRSHKLIRSLVGATWLYEVGPDALDEGPDLLSAGPLDPEAGAAYEALSEALDARLADLPP